MQEFNTKLFNYDAFRGCSEGVVGVQNTLKDPRKPRTYRVLMTYVYNTGEIIKKREMKGAGTKKASHNVCSRKLPENRI